MASNMDIDEEDEDPVIAEYDVFMAPELKHHLYLLQYPNRKRDSPYNNHNQTTPSELRIKPKAAFMELDIEVTAAANFDKFKGLQWGQALRHAKDSGSAGFGMSGGFGKGNRSTELIVSGRARKKGEEDVDKMLLEFDEMARRGRVLSKQTLGGQIMGPTEGKPIYMLGTFKESELHLHEISGVTQMRPQFHHIDAHAQITKTTVARSNAQKPKPQEARAVTQVQRNDPGENESSKSYHEADQFLKNAAEEVWSRLDFHDEEDPESYEIFAEKMLPPKDTANAANLHSEWTSQQYLDAIDKVYVEVQQQKPFRKRAPAKKDGATTGGSVRRT